MTRYYMSLVIESVFSLYKLIAAGFRKNQLGTHCSRIFSWKMFPHWEDPIAITSKERGVQTLSGFTHSLGGFRFPGKGLLCHLSAETLENIAYCLPHVVMPFGKRQRKMVKWWPSSQNLQSRSDRTCCFHVENRAQRTELEGCAVPLMQLTHGLRITMHPTSPTV